MSSFLALLLFFFTSCFSIKAICLRRRRMNVKYPPGPTPKFLIGNLLDMPSTDSARVFIEWGKKYNSDILYASALGNRIFVLNKRKDAEEIFERRSRIYSDRQSLPLIKMMGWDRNIGLNQYGDKWRLHRKICQQNFNQRAANNYEPLIKSKVQDLLKGFLDSPDKFDEHTKMFSTSIPLSAMYGYEVESLDDELVQLADQSLLMGTTLLTPRGSLINVFPFLKHVPAWFPGASSHRAAREVNRLTEILIQKPFDWVKEQINEGTHAPSLVSDFLEGQKGRPISQEDEDVISDIAFSIYVGGSDTTKSLLRTFIYLMATHPEIQRKAQMEIDQITDGNRLPDFQDRASMPYSEAMYRELMRWMPPLHIGLPHYSSEDDIYEGFLIPKGTTVIGNIWAMTHDEETYPQPNVFNPDRFFDEDGNLNDDDHVLAYGFGRRVCVGKYVATSIVWSMITSILASFDIGKAKDSMGSEIEIKEDFVDYGILTHKKAFKCSIKPRSNSAKTLITGK